MPPQVELPKPVSFLRSIWEGIKGYFKGGLAGMAIGALLIGGIAAAIAVFAPAGSMEFIKSAVPSLGKIIPAGIGRAAAAATAGLIGGAWGASVFGSLGSIAGLFTGVVKSREAGQLTPGQFANSLNMAHQHGEVVGEQRVVNQLSAHQQQQKEENYWRDKRAAEQAKTAAQKAANPAY